MTASISPKPQSLVERIRDDLVVLKSDYLAMLDTSRLRCLVRSVDGLAEKEVPCDDDRCGHTLEWAPEPPANVVTRMLLDRRLTELSQQHHSIYPTQMVEVQGLLGGYAHLRTYLNRNFARMSGGRGGPLRLATEAFAGLLKSLEYLPPEEVATRLVVDTTALMDNPDLARYKPTVGKAYTVHLVPQVLREVDHNKDREPGPKQELARKVDSRLRGYSNGGDVRTGVPVAEGVQLVFDFREPRNDGLPGWLDLKVPDDRIIASALELQYRHPRSAVVVGARDNAMIGKLAGAGIPHFRTDIPKEPSE